MSETKEVYDEIKNAYPSKGSSGGSGIPVGYVFGSSDWQVEVGEGQINLYPPNNIGGCVCLYPDGTWAGDIAPFCG